MLTIAKVISRVLKLYEDNDLTIKYDSERDARDKFHIAVPQTYHHAAALFSDAFYHYNDEQSCSRRYE